MAYGLTPVSLSSGVLVFQNTGYGGFPPSFSTGIVSAWFCMPASNTAFTLNIGGSLGGLVLTFTTSQITVGLYANGGALVGQATATPPFPLTATRYNFLLSYDTVANNIQIFINNEVVSGSIRWFASEPIGIDTFESGWGFSTSNTALGVSDYWAGITPSFIDLTIASNRQKFITILNAPVDLGPVGEYPTGSQPAVFLHQPAGSSNPDDFAINLGSGGTYQISTGTITFPAPNQCTVPPAPFIPPIALTTYNLQPITGVCVPPCCIEFDCGTRAKAITGW